MATEARKLQLGLFVIGASIIGIAALVWLGASRYLEDTEYVVAYFSESVQGLATGSAVKYRGVPEGRVESIDIAPDKSLIEVVMSVDEGFAEFLQSEPELRAQIQLAGITGLRYVEIDRHTGEALDKSPKISFEPPYPVVKTSPSSIKAIQEAFEDLYEEVMKVDIGAISNDIRDALRAATLLLQDERIPELVGELNEVARSARVVTGNLERITANLRVEGVAENISETAATARNLIEQLREADIGRRLSEAMGQVGYAAQSTQQLMIALQRTVERLERTVSNLEGLAGQVREQPSLLLFSEPPQEKRPGGR